jgi:hypothetical protein
MNNVLSFIMAFLKRKKPYSFMSTFGLPRPYITLPRACFLTKGHDTDFVS